MSAQTIGLVAFGITVAYTAIGLPLQIRENHRRKSVAGQSAGMQWLLLGTFASWVAYGMLKPDWYVLFSNAPGAVCVALLLAQRVVYSEQKQSCV